MNLRLSRDDSIEKGERDRPGRPSRRPADWSDAPWATPDGALVRRANVFGGTPKTAGETPALPRATESFRLSVSLHRTTLHGFAFTRLKLNLLSKTSAKRD